MAQDPKRVALLQKEGSASQDFGGDSGVKIEVAEDSTQVKSSDSILTSCLSIFFGNLAKNSKFILALSMGFWITLFFVPVCHPYVHDWVFPPTCTSTCKTGDSKTVPPSFCTGIDGVGFKPKECWSDVEEDTVLPTEGLNLPAKVGPNIEGYWPNVVQLMFFTVYQSSTGSVTGGTVHLGIQGIVGTLAANMNVGFMSHLFPVGGKCKDPILNIANTPNLQGILGLRAFCDEYYDPNFEKYFWFVWVDFFLFMFLILASNSGELVMKFGLSWHMFYMMGFISNAGYVKSHAVMFTSFMGVFLAIICTLMPARQKSENKDYDGTLTFENLATNNLPKYTAEVRKRIKKACKTSVDYMQAVCSSSANNCRENAKIMSKRFTVETCVDDIPGIIANLSLDHADAWYEKFVYFMLCRPNEFKDKYGDAALFLQAFGDNIGGFDDALRLLKKAVVADGEANIDEEAVRNQATKEREDLAPGMNEMAQLTDSLLECMAAEGDYDTVKADEISKKLGQSIVQVRAAYNDMARASVPAQPAMRMLRTNQSIYVFAFICLAHKTLDMAEEAKKSEQLPTCKDGAWWKSRLHMIVAWIFCTFCSETDESATFAFNVAGKRWKPFGQLFDNKEKRMFAFRNWLSIGIVFVMGDYFFGNVFKPAFNPAMAGTLAVLISHFPGSAFYKNLMRLLGITLGKVLPIIIMALVGIAGKEGGAVTYVHLAAVFIYEAFFALMYYTSPEWSYVGCLCAGFGCYGLVGLKVGFATDDVFVSKYEEIGSVVAAIMVQIVIDTTDTAWRKKFPRDVVVENLAEMVNGKGDPTDERPIEDSGLIDAYRRIETQEWGKIKKVLSRVKDKLASQTAMLDECKEKTQVITAMSRPMFKHVMYKQCCDHISNLVSELEALCLVDEYFNNFIHEDFKVALNLQAVDEKSVKKYGWEEIFKAIPAKDFALPIQIALSTFHEAVADDGSDLKVKLPKDASTKLDLEADDINAGATGTGNAGAKVKKMGMLFDVVAKLLPEARRHALSIEHELYTNGITITFEEEA